MISICIIFVSLGMIKRHKETEVRELFEDFPAVAIIGPRQCGKTTLAKEVMNRMNLDSNYLDLEDPDDAARLTNPTLFFEQTEDQLICLDEIQMKSDLWETLKGTIDRRGRNGQFLILGSASPELIKRSSETLAGRIAFVELKPLSLPELGEEDPFELWLQGGFPRSFLARNKQASMTWRKNFIKTFLERDLNLWGIGVPPEMMRRFWRMCAHLHGQVINYSQIGKSLGVSHTTARQYIDIMQQTFMIHLLEPYHGNLKKRIIRSPKLYLTDTGLLHALLDIQSMDHLLGHPVAGNSWEGFVLQQIRATIEDQDLSYIRSSGGEELDIILEKGTKRMAVECKLSRTPNLKKSFYNLLTALDIEEGMVVAPVNTPFPLSEKVMVRPLMNALNTIKEFAP